MNWHVASELTDVRRVTESQFDMGEDDLAPDEQSEPGRDLEPPRRWGDRRPLRAGGVLRARSRAETLGIDCDTTFKHKLATEPARDEQ